MIPKIFNFNLVRGDDKHFFVNVKNLESPPDELIFSVKRSTKMKTYLIQKAIGSGIEQVEAGEGYRYMISLVPSDTESLEPVVYCYDVEARINNEIHTLVMGEISLLADTTRHLQEG